MRLIVGVQLAMPVSGGEMKHKTKSSRTDELRREYTRSDFPNGFVRGKYAARMARGSRIATLDSDTSAESPTGTAKR
jgi:hypothetical protein